MDTRSWRFLIDLFSRFSQNRSFFACFQNQFCFRNLCSLILRVSLVPLVATLSLCLSLFSPSLPSPSSSTHRTPQQRTSKCIAVLHLLQNIVFSVHFRIGSSPTTEPPSIPLDYLSKMSAIKQKVHTHTTHTHTRARTHTQEDAAIPTLMHVLLQVEWLMVDELISLSRECSPVSLPLLHAVASHVQTSQHVSSSCSYQRLPVKFVFGAQKSILHLLTVSLMHTVPIE